MKKKDLEKRIEEKRIELIQALKEFPSPRNHPMEAIEAKENIRLLGKELIQCQRELSDHAPSQDVQS